MILSPTRTSVTRVKSASGPPSFIHTVSRDPVAPTESVIIPRTSRREENPGAKFAPSATKEATACLGWSEGT